MKELLLISLGSAPFVLYPEPECLQHAGHHYRQHHHREQVEHHEINPAELARDGGVRVHENEPVVDDRQLEERDAAGDDVLEVVQVVVAECRRAVQRVFVEVLHRCVDTAIPEIVASEQLHADDGEEVVHDQHHAACRRHQRGQQDQRTEHIAVTLLQLVQTHQSQRSKYDDNEEFGRDAEQHGAHERQQRHAQVEMIL